MKFAFIIMGDFTPATHRAGFPGAEMVGVSSVEEACAVAKEQKAAGVDCIELCGAFEEAGARAVIEATGGEVPVGYVVHLPEQDALFRALFG